MKKQILVCLALLSAAVSSNADITSVNGLVAEINPIQSDLTKGGGFQSSSITQLMFEGTSTVGAGGLTVYTDVASKTTAFLAEGTQVNSYIFHFDPKADMGYQVTFNGGGAVFDNNILGLVGSSADLDATDYLGNAGTVYPTGYRQRNAGFGDGPDSFGTDGDIYSFSGNTFTIDQLTTNFNRIDQIRVLTAVPEPSTIAGIGIGVFALGFLTYRRRKAAVAAA